MWFKNSAEFNVSSPFRIWPGLSYMVAIKQKTSKVKSEGVYIYAIKHNFILSLK